MTEMEFVFEESALEQFLSEVPEGGTVSAARFLTLLQSCPGESAEDALEELVQKNVLLDISDLPKDFSAGDMAVRLRMEQDFVQKGMPLDMLEENDPLGLYLKEIGAIPACGDVTVLSGRLVAGDETAASKIADLMIGTVVTMASEMTGKGVLLLDLIQEGSLGLWQGILSYQAGDMESHCRRYISIYLARCVTQQAWQAGVGQWMRQTMEDYRDVDRKLLDELGRNPTLEEIALELHITTEMAEVFENMLRSAKTVASAHETMEEKEVTEEDTQAVEDTAYFQSRQRIMELLSGLSETDAKLLTMRFGLEGGLPLSPEQTGMKLGLTAQEVVQREAAALQLLRQQKS